MICDTTLYIAPAEKDSAARWVHDVTILAVAVVIFIVPTVLGVAALLR